MNDKYPKDQVISDGRIIITLPFADNEYPISGFKRWHDLSRVQRLFKGLNILTEEYFIPDSTILGRKVKSIPGSLTQFMEIGDIKII